MPSVDLHSTSSHDRRVARPVDDVERLIRGESVGSRIHTDTDAVHTEMDIVDDLLTTAWFNEYQLGVLVGLVHGVERPERTVADVLDQAHGVGIASRGAIGVATTLLGCVRNDDEEAVADVLGRAIHAFDEEDLRAGATALTMALTLAVARVVALEPDMTHREMIAATFGADVPQASSTPDRSGSLRRHLPGPARRRPTMETCRRIGRTDMSSVS